MQESVLLKKLLRLNTQRSVQKLKMYGSPTWCFSSFLQPVYAVLAEYDLLKQGAMARAPDVSDGCKSFDYYCFNSVFQAGFFLTKRYNSYNYFVA